MQNFSVTIDKKQFWISRSMAVAGFIFSLKDNKLVVLANLRGRGCPNYQGYWNCPCGYLDFDETLKQACSREVFEETNLIVNPENLNIYKIDDDPNSLSQNVTVSFWTFSQTLYKEQTIFAKGFESNEVESVAWIGMDELDSYKWAFNHKNIIESIVADRLGKYLTK